jgi:hypothetical protein
MFHPWGGGAGRARIDTLNRTAYDTTQFVRVQARDFAGGVPINVVVTPLNGPRRVVPAEITMAPGNPAFVNVAVTIPLDTEAAINAWTR